MDARDTAVRDELGPEPERLQRRHRLVGDRQVGGAGRDHEHAPRPLLRRTPDDGAPASDAAGVSGQRRVGLRVVSPSEQHGQPWRTSLRQQLRHDLGAVLWSLPRPVHRLGCALPQRPVVVDAGEPEIGEREPAQPADGVVRIEHARSHVVEQLAESGFVHVRLVVLRLMARIAFLGPSGTFGEEALSTQGDLVDEELVPMTSHAEVIAATVAGEVDLGFVGFENSIEGSVRSVLDSLIFDVDLLIQREVVLPISQNLVAPAGTSMSDVRRVVSFPDAMEQCREFFGRELPDAELVPANSTAEAVRLVAEERPAATAALGTALAAKLYGLEVVAAGIEDHRDNSTRFVLVARDGIPAPTGHDKTTIVQFQQADRPGNLHLMAAQFAARDINLTRFESRPTKESLGDYCFLIEFTGHLADDVVADCLRNLRADVGPVKFLGSYPAVGEGADVARQDAERRWHEADAWIEELRRHIRR